MARPFLVAASQVLILAVLAFHAPASAQKVRPDSITVKFAMNFDHTFEELAKASGVDTLPLRTTYQNNFQDSNAVTIELQLVTFDEELTTAQVLERLKGWDLQPATIEQLLAVHLARPSLDMPVVALGTVYEDGEIRMSPGVIGPQGERTMRHYCTDRPAGEEPHTWETAWYFLTVVEIVDVSPKEWDAQDNSSYDPLSL